MLSPRARRNWGKILPFGFLWMIYSYIYTFIEKGILGDSPIYPSTGNVYQFDSAVLVTALLAFPMGLAVGSIETFYFNRLFINRSYASKILLKSVLYILLIIAFLIVLSTVGNSIRNDMPIWKPEVLLSVKAFFASFAFWSIIIYIGSILSISVFLAEVSDNLGQGVLYNFLFGRYHKPREEERVFMFMDMRSSTTIAEKLGHIRYFELLQKCYFDITDAIIDSDGEIYQYVGDEVVLTWKLKRGISNSNCLQAYFNMRKAINENAEEYSKSFGLVPEFKAGLHYGEVTTGEVGVMKKDIVFTGDVLNSAARIQGLCNQKEVDILLSKQLVDQLKPSSNGFEFVAMGDATLRGRDEKINLYTVTQVPT